ncbi:MAG: hypothetical protein KDA97_04820 [Acidimicrobiales bacterium]|nr:hypothetical protein [Acidimicrobiales bacterium]
MDTTAVEADEDALADGPRPTDGSDDGGAASGGVSWNQVIALLFAVVGLRIGLAPLSDNSFFTHLATGRIIVSGGGIPRADPYSFTALGEPWTVQSWLASVVYAGIEDVVGLVGVRVLIGVCTMLLALLVWRLTRPAELLVGRLCIAVPVLAIGSTRWVERPLIFGMLLLAAVLLALEDELDPRWLVPVMWLWVNTHGSFPLGLVAIGAYGLGRLLDRERPTLELRVGAWATLGTLLGAINPLGLDVLTFPLGLLERREAFSQIVEWQAPTWQDWGERFFAVQLAIAVVLLLWRGRSWRTAVPLVIFGLAAVTSSRNILQASLVLVPGMALAARGLGSIDGRQALPILRPVRVALVALLALVAVIGLTRNNTNLVDYPVESAEWLRDHDALGLDDRVVTRDFVGNYLEAAYGPDEVRTYLDDRVDMYPIEIIEDYTVLIDPDGDYGAVLDRADATAVIWDKDTPFAEWLADPDNGWEIVFDDEELWLVAMPAESSP